MLNRRFLRIKTMQALYSYFKNENADMHLFEKELFKGIDLVYDLYLCILNIFGELRANELMWMEENKNKRLPTASDLNPNLAFVNNSLLKEIAENKALKELVQKRKLESIVDSDLVRKLLQEIKKTDEYLKYMSLQAFTVKEDRELLINIVVKVLDNNEVLNSIFEEKSIYWADDKHMAYQSVLKTFEAFNGTFKLLPLMKDEKDDRAFVKNLFEKTILYKEHNFPLIETHVKNWEMDRIAEMDMLLMEMCITEILYVPNVPVKASLNEYIDISKEYSTPNSRVFINGILDKVIFQLKAENKIVKEGRGLKES